MAYRDQSANRSDSAPYRVMVVDDSAIIRGFLSRYLTEDPQIDVVTTASNGAMALRQLDKFDVEVVVLDIEMPEMDGMTALPKILEMKPDVQVVMASTLTRKNADISMRALQLGAVDYVPKPETARSVNASIDFRRELVEKVKAWAARRRKRAGVDAPKSVPAASTTEAPTGRSGFVSARRPIRPAAVVTTSGREPSKPREAAVAKVDKPIGAKPSLSKRSASMRTPEILAIGSSTGGPQALLKFFEKFDKAPNVPILITQHMPATFTAILADHIHQATGWPCAEALDGEELRKGQVYVAPGGKHMVVSEDGTPKIRITDDPPENFCKPAVDPMLRSLIPVYGDRTLVVILTGMGHDGLKGSRDLTRVGGTIMAQDEATSVVWGMPGAVATAGLCSEILPLDELGTSVAEKLKRVPR